MTEKEAKKIIVEILSNKPQHAFLEFQFKAKGAGVPEDLFVKVVTDMRKAKEAWVIDPTAMDPRSYIELNPEKSQ